MLYRLTANKSGFKEIPFHPGLNIVLGVKTDQSDTRQTCNSLGKSTALQIIDFCLGSDVDAHGTLPASKLDDWAFTLELDLGGQRVKVTRSTFKDSLDLIMVEGDVSNWPIQPELTHTNGLSQYSLKRWRMLLGKIYFNLNPENESINDEIKQPSYRELSAYFHRTAYISHNQPQGHGSNAAQSEKTLAYLLGFDWEYVSKVYKLTSEKSTFNKIKDAASAKCKDWNIKMQALGKQCIKLSEELKLLETGINEFKLDPIYSEHERQVEELTTKINALRRRCVSARGLLKSAKKSLQEETADSAQLESIYKDAGIIFTDQIRRTLEDVKVFHEEVVKNRKEFLKGQIKDLSRQIREDERQTKDLGEKREAVMKHLRTHGAIDTLVNLNEARESLLIELTEKKACLQDYNNAKNSIEEIKAEQAELVSDAETLYKQFDKYIKSIVQTYETITNTMYEKKNPDADNPGKMTVSFEKRGNDSFPRYRFEPTLDASGGPGVDKMKLYAFDMSVFIQQKVLGKTPPPMLHDGEIFVSTDGRQRAAALEIAHRLALEIGGQYITGMNDDVVPSQFFSHGFDFEKSVCLKLFDGAPERKLLGFDFDANAPKKKEAKDISQNGDSNSDDQAEEETAS